jgi:hypothetical protein
MNRPTFSSLNLFRPSLFSLASALLVSLTVAPPARAYRDCFTVRGHTWYFLPVVVEPLKDIEIDDNLEL